jgi:methylated-DNA-[protein]-cysteine S-methyltransferase
LNCEINNLPKTLVSPFRSNSSLKMNTIHLQFFQTDFGNLILCEFEGKQCLCDWRFHKNRALTDTRIQKGLNAGFTESGFVIVKKKLLQQEGIFSRQDLILL